MSEDEFSSLQRAEKGLDELMGYNPSEVVKRIAKEIYIERHTTSEKRNYSVEIIKNKDTGIESAVIKLLGRITYSTSEKNEIELLKLIDTGKDFNFDIFKEENEE